MTSDINAEQQLIQLLSSIETSDNILLNPLSVDADLEKRLISWFDTDFHGNLEITSKQIIYKYSMEEDHTKISTFSLLLDVIYQFSRLGKCELPLVHTLLEEVMDSEPISWCQEFWSYLQPREHQIASNLSGIRAPGTTLIRMCNSLVRRLSKTSDAQFSGRIAMFLARAFPLSEKSGLNMRGSYNLENVTLYNSIEDKLMEDTEQKEESEPEKTVQAETKTTRENTPKEHAPKEKTSKENTPLDKIQTENDYENFWSLQDYFRNPTQLLSDETLEIYKRKAQKVLQLLRSNEPKGTISREFTDGLNSESTRKSEINGSENDDQFVAKWLTSPDLFELELKDRKFRSTVYAQMFIICEFILGLSESSKERWNEINAKNSSVMYSYTLNAQNKKAFEELEADILKLAGPTFKETFVHIGKMDDMWQEWKLQNCPAFGEGTMTLTGFDKVEQTFNALKEPRKKFWHSMGTAALSRLWKTTTGLDRLKNSERVVIPKPIDYLEKVTALSSNEPEADEETNGNAKPEANTTEIELLTWQGLRAARDKGQWSLFNRIDATKGFAGLFENPAEDSSEESVGEETPDVDNENVEEKEDVTETEKDETPEVDESVKVETPAIEGEGESEEKQEDDTEELEKSDDVENPEELEDTVQTEEVVEGEENPIDDEAGEENVSNETAELEQNGEEVEQDREQNEGQNEENGDQIEGTEEEREQNGEEREQNEEPVVDTEMAEQNEKPTEENTTESDSKIEANPVSEEEKPDDSQPRKRLRRSRRQNTATP